MDISTYASYGTAPKHRDLITATVYGIDRDGIWLQPEGPAPADIFIDPADAKHFHFPNALNLGDTVRAFITEPEDEDGRCVGSLSLANRTLIRQELPTIAEETTGTIRVIIGRVAKSQRGKEVGLLGLTDTRLGPVECFIPRSMVPDQHKQDMSEAVGQTFEGTIVDTGASNIVVNLGPALAIKPDYDAAEEIRLGQTVTGVVESIAHNGGIRILLSNGAPAYVPVDEVGEVNRKSLSIGTPVKGTVLKIRRKSGDIPDHMRWMVIVSFRSNAEWEEFKAKTSTGEYMVAEVVKVLVNQEGETVILGRPENWPGIIGRVENLIGTTTEGARLFVKRGDVTPERRRLRLDADVPLATTSKP